MSIYDSFKKKLSKLFGGLVCGGVRICQHFFHVDKFGRMFMSFAQIDGNSPFETDLTAH